MHNFESAVHNSSAQPNAPPSPYLPMPNSTQRSTKTAPANSTQTAPPPPQKPYISRLEKLKQLNATINEYGPELLSLAGFVVCASLVSVGVMAAVMFVVWLMGASSYLFFQGVKFVFF